MTDYHNEETASWDARKVREEADALHSAAAEEDAVEAAGEPCAAGEAEENGGREADEQGNEEAPMPKKKQPKPKKPYRYHRRLNPVLYVIMVMIISGLAACIGWLLRDDAWSLNKPWT